MIIVIIIVAAPRTAAVARPPGEGRFSFELGHFIPIHLPKRVLQTSDCIHFFCGNVLQSVLGVGMGRNFTAHLRQNREQNMANQLLLTTPIRWDLLYSPQISGCSGCISS